MKAKRTVAPLPRGKRDVEATGTEHRTAGFQSIADEMTELDREINDLRQQLSEKLRRQNTYLRERLRRYDAL